MEFRRNIIATYLKKPCKLRFSPYNGAPRLDDRAKTQKAFSWSAPRRRLQAGEINFVVNPPTNVYLSVAALREAI